MTGSVDRTCKLWDMREDKPKQTFFGHESDVNSVCVSKCVEEGGGVGETKIVFRMCS